MFMIKTVKNLLTYLLYFIKVRTAFNHSNIKIIVIIQFIILILDKCKKVFKV